MTPRLALWIEVTPGCAFGPAILAAKEHFEVEKSPSPEAAATRARRDAPQVACWDFEQADPASLRAMRDFKIAHPSVPLLMLTSQHSESLAVWAFRARVWNYLVKPVSASELRANFSSLARLTGAPGQPARSMHAICALLPCDLDSNAESVDGSCLRQALSYVETQYSGKIRQSETASLCGMSTSRFSRSFKAEFGLTFSEYLMRFRIGRACRLLRQGSHSATTAGLAVGFEDPSHFARAFRRLLGVSPSHYQQKRGALRPVTERRHRSRAIPGRASLRAARAPPPALPLAGADQPPLAGQSPSVEQRS